VSMSDETLSRPTRSPQTGGLHVSVESRELPVVHQAVEGGGTCARQDFKERGEPIAVFSSGGSQR